MEKGNNISVFKIIVSTIAGLVCYTILSNISAALLSIVITILDKVPILGKLLYLFFNIIRKDGAFAFIVVISAYFGGFITFSFMKRINKANEVEEYKSCFGIGVLLIIMHTIFLLVNFKSINSITYNIVSILSGIVFIMHSKN